MTNTIDTTVLAILPEFCQTYIRADDGRLYALTESTAIRWDEVSEGDRLRCTVTRRLPRVLSVQRIEA